MRKLNILHIITKLELGGAQENTLYTLKNLDRKRYNLFLAANDEGILVEEAKRMKDVEAFFIPELIRPISPLKDLMALVKLFRFCKREKIDIIHTHSSKAGILGRGAAKLARVPIITHTIHGWGFYPKQGLLKKRLFIFLEKMTAKITDRLIAVSRANIETGIENRIGRKEKYTLIRSGIKPFRFQNVEVDVAEKKKELGLEEDTKVVAMIACLKPQKAPLDFVKVANQVIKKRPKTQFLLIGDGRLRPEIERLIKTFDLEKKVILAGWRKDIPQILKVIDVLTLTSRWEGLPRVFPEAMASELPIVATKVDGASEAVEEGVNGFLISVGDIGGMAEKIISLLDNPGMAKKMGKKGKEKVFPEFDIDLMVEKIDDLYQELTRTKGLQ
ncbi:glycosyltransferase family 4 protein [bacterium]|nr:glycosyltransferase family 4 protein [bacterium]